VRAEREKLYARRLLHLFGGSNITAAVAAVAVAAAAAAAAAAHANGSLKSTFLDDYE
jgi:methyl coenzyme M reductase alpha subunit